MPKKISSDEFHNLTKGLANDVVAACVQWRLYTELLKSLQAEPDVEAQSRSFWNLTLGAHSMTAVQHLCRAFDQQRNALSLGRWLCTIRDNLHLFSPEELRKRLASNPFVESLVADSKLPLLGLLNSGIQSCSSSDVLVNTLVKHRNNIAIHRNEGIFMTGHMAKFEIPVIEFEALLERARTTLHRYTMLFNAESYSTNMVGQDDYKYVVKCIAESVLRAREVYPKPCGPSY